MTATYFLVVPAMEDSTNLFMEQALSYSKEAESPEESGWTPYFEDFLSNNREHTVISSPVYETSLISDARSCAAKYVFDNDFIAAADRQTKDRPDNICKRLKFKKQRRQGLGDDDDDDEDLVDTATSPANSPKVNHLKVSNISPKKREISGGYQGNTSAQYSALYTNDTSDFTELKKKGLCLVPLSTVINYLG
ncbi:hypothetical protein GIB67_021094 [Kingdonia uniflora]|uniref:Uncharacterized protein n=1 Tax=Kingdonia uniflora TaxID=39325 RepID=A0A7J7N722_9MAGN|nr:hypothetical protein GIB67_021094 [Kingdonia uniflora]